MPEDPNPAPAPASAPEPGAPPVSAETPAAPAAGLEPKVAACLCCIFPIVGSIIFLVLEKKDKFVRFWAMQSLLFGILAFAAAVVFFFAYLILGHMPFVGGMMRLLLGAAYWLFRIGWLIGYVICIVKAFSNVEWELPILGKIAREQLAKMDGQQPAAS